uniref:Uncharacterized protein n=1 Tax=Plectus sambesii TaxID=2011161 RepID=A0A914V630_9BILA
MCVKCESEPARFGFLQRAKWRRTASLNDSHLVINFRNCHIDACQSWGETGGAFIIASTLGDDGHLWGSFYRSLCAIRATDVVVVVVVSDRSCCVYEYCCCAQEFLRMRAVIAQFAPRLHRSY